MSCEIKLKRLCQNGNSGKLIQRFIDDRKEPLCIFDHAGELKARVGRVDGVHLHAMAGKNSLFLRDPDGPVEAAWKYDHAEFARAALSRRGRRGKQGDCGDRCTSESGQLIEDAAG